MAERLLRVFHHGTEAYQVHLCPGDHVIANGTDIGIVQPEEKSPFQTTAAQAEAARGVLLGKDTGVSIETVDKRGRKAAEPKPKAPAKKTAARKVAGSRKKTAAKKR